MNTKPAALWAVGLLALILTGCSTTETTPTPAAAPTIQATSPITATPQTTGPSQNTAPTTQTSTAASTAPAPTTASPSSGKATKPKAVATGTQQPCQVSCGDNAQYNGPANLPAPSWAPGDKDAAQQAALATMAEYIKPGTDHATWFNNIRPRITTQFAIELDKFDPTYLTVSKITGKATATTEANNPFQVIVSIPTDDGVYKVTMLRANQTAFWLTNSIVPPLPGGQ